MLRTDHPTLDAAAVVAERQADHLHAADRFVSTHLSDLDAFRGVLSLFRDEYAAALGHVHAGLEASASRAALLGDAFLRCRRLYAAVDEQAAAHLVSMADAVDEVVPVVPVGHVSAPPPPPLPAPADAPALPDLPDLPMPGEEGGGASPTLGLLDEVAGVQDSAVSLDSGVRDLDATLDDLAAYDDFEHAS